MISNSVVLVIAKQTVELGTRLAPDADAAITIDATDTAVPITGGKLGGLLGIRNGILKDVREQLDELANRLVAEFDALHTKGVGTSGSFTRLDSRRLVDDIAANLDSTGLAFPPSAGNLTFAVTDTATGNRVLTTLPPLDPGAVSLTGLAAMISANVANVTAVESSENGSMTLLSAPGFEFDLAGGFDTTPTYDMTGTGAAQATTSTLTLGGTF